MIVFVYINNRIQYLVVLTCVEKLRLFDRKLNYFDVFLLKLLTNVQKSDIFILVQSAISAD